MKKIFPSALNKTFSETSSKKDYKLIFFGILVAFLIFWAFWGDRFEQEVFGTSIKYPETGYLGAQIVIPDLTIGDVCPGSPADRSGLKTGDQIIGIDGKFISNKNLDLETIHSKKIGDTLRLTVNRDGRNKNIFINLTPLQTNISLRSKSMSFIKKIAAIIIFSNLTILMFFLIYKKFEKRVSIVVVFAVITLIFGMFFNIYSVSDAFLCIQFNMISLMLGMGIISAALDEIGLFDYLVYLIHESVGDSRQKTFILFSLFSYTLSLFVSNLTTMLVIIPMTVYLANAKGFNPAMLIIGEIISSNLGGASTMLGEFPNMIILSEAGIGFTRFIAFMMPVCLILLGILLLFLKAKVLSFDAVKKNNDETIKIVKPKFNEKDRKSLRIIIIIFCHMIILLFLSEKFFLRPSAIALVSGVAVYIFSGVNRKKLLDIIGFDEMLFFAGLFVVVGGLEASGLFQYFAKGITIISYDKPWILCLLIMYIAAFFTTFLSAGPATVLFSPIVLWIAIAPAHHIIWWSLSLGVLAGSCATLTGSTAGPLTMDIVENMNHRYKLNINKGADLTLRDFKQIGVPVMFIFLAASSLYILWLYLYL